MTITLLQQKKAEENSPRSEGEEEGEDNDGRRRRRKERERPGISVICIRTE